MDSLPISAAPVIAELRETHSALRKTQKQLGVLKRLISRDDMTLKRKNLSEVTLARVSARNSKQKSHFRQIQLEQEKILSSYELAKRKRQRTYSFIFATARISIWQGYKNLLIEMPISGFDQRANRYYGSNGAQKRTDISHPHPHNFALELWTDLGLMGVSLFGLVLVVSSYAMREFNPKTLSAVSAAIVAGFCQSMTGAGFLQGWWIASLSMVAIALIAITDASSKNAAKPEQS